MNHKTKITILVASLIVSIALLNVGFAAWVFSNQAEKTYEASVSTEMVSDRSCILEDVSDKELGTDRESIHFGVPKDRNIEDAWLDSWEATKPENLTYKVALKVSKNITDIYINFSVKRGNSDAFNDFDGAVKDGLIAAPACIVADEKNGTTSEYFLTPVNTDGYSFVLNRNKDHDFPTDNDEVDPKDTVTIFVTIKFDWGEHFHGQNPYFYYNSMSRTDMIENAYTYKQGEPPFVDTTSGQNAEAHIDAYASLYKLNNFIMGSGENKDGLQYHYVFRGSASEQ